MLLFEYVMFEHAIFKHIYRLEIRLAYFLQNWPQLDAKGPYLR